MRKLKAVITDYQYENVDTERKLITDSGAELVDCHCKTEGEVVEATRDADAVVVQYCNATENVIERLEHCRLIIKYGIGVDNIDVPAATKKGIFVANVPDYGVEEVSNHTVAFLLALARKLPQMTRGLKDGAWGYSMAVPAGRLSLRTLGLIGFGRIPREVCRKALAFGMRVLASDPFVGEEAIRAAGAEPADLDTLLRESDYVSCHCPLTEQTRHCIDRSAMEKMKPTACLINTARGGIICESDLIDALKRGRIAGAALDVYEKEPLPADSELLRLPNVLATGHSAWYTEEAIQTLQRKVAEEVVRVFEGNPPLNPVNRGLLRGAPKQSR